MIQGKKLKRVKNRIINRKEQGITLIALVITIIILLILATVTLNVVLGEGGLIDRAQQAKDMTEQAALEEQQGLNSLMSEYANIMAEDQTPPEPEIPYIDDSIVEAPQTSSGMTPVKYDENQSKWIKTEVTDSEWYDYGNKEWANVVLVGENGKDADGDQDVFNSDGTLNEDSNYSMLVWIPRYAYKINSQYHQSGTGAGEIDIVFIGTDNKGKDGSKTYSTEYPEGTTGGAMSDYVVHPAFDYGGTALAGFWVGKFETSHTGCTTDKSTGETNTDVTTLTAQIKPGVTSWRSINVSDIFTVCTNMNAAGNPYGLNTSDSVVDPHMMKNSEWGSVAYLSQNATYGKGSEVWINPNSNYITGQAGSSVSAGSTTSTSNYNTGNGPQASTTGNVTGVYDMSGGAWEYTAAYINNSYTQSGGGSYIYAQSLMDSVNAGNTKYADVYKVTSDSQSNNYNNAQPTMGQGTPTKDTGHYGDAVWETSNNYSSTNCWYSDYSNFPNSYVPFFIRGGGSYNDRTIAGVFSFNGSDGYLGLSSFRVVVPVLQ